MSSTLAAVVNSPRRAPSWSAQRVPALVRLAPRSEQLIAPEAPVPRSS